MTIWKRLEQLNLSRYQLAQVCGLSWAEVSGLCMGKRPLSRCGAETIEKLAQAMGLSRQELLELETGPQASALDPESGLPGFVRQSIENLLQGELEQVSHWTVCTTTCTAPATRRSGAGISPGNRRIICEKSICSMEMRRIYDRFYPL